MTKSGVLQASLRRVDVWELQHTKRFLEVSRHSFDWSLGRKGKEGFLLKQSGGYTNLSNPMTNNWRKRWFMLKDSCLVYFVEPEAEEPRVCHVQYRERCVSPFPGTPVGVLAALLTFLPCWCACRGCMGGGMFDCMPGRRACR